ncbi:MAG TPA: type II toxin-antitoxin system RelB/DinJ family antitoxin [Leptospiraceae bacterium]|nr:type II toxin-antitoxin system RelB/DinJ family antitoxin [Leptospiraceae bacterium]
MNTKAIIFQAPEDLKSSATEALDECGVTLSEYLRLCLERFVERKTSKNIKSEIEKVADSVIDDLGV